MTFEFLVACHLLPATDTKQMLTELLARVLETNGVDLPEGVIAEMVQLRHERPGGEVVDDNGQMNRHMLIGFSLELPEDTESIQSVIEEFAKALPDTTPVFHAVKFEDPLLKDQLAERATEIFTIEMKLRRVLSFIYLHAYQGDNDPYDLLQDETVQIPQRERPSIEQMEAASENEFFYLLFSQYVNFNKRADLPLPSILDFIRNSEQYDALRVKILRNPIEHEKDAEFLTSLKSLMDPIESMRNCVAHNRRPTRSLIDNYPNARRELEERLNGYLAQWEVQRNC